MVQGQQRADAQSLTTARRTIANQRSASRLAYSFNVYLLMRNGDPQSESLTRCNEQNGIQASITGMLCPLLKLVSGCATRDRGAYSGLSPHLQGQSFYPLSHP